MSWMCHLGIHKWEPWQVLKHGNVIDEHSPTRDMLGYYIMQVRSCYRCQKAEIREQRTNK